MHEQLHEKGNQEPEENEQKLIVEFMNDTLRVSFNHEMTQTRERLEALLDYYQFRFSQRAGRLVPREEIRVSPIEGEAVPATTSFSVKIGEPLYIGLQAIHAESPAVLPKLITDMEKYNQTHPIDESQGALIRHAINGLKEIIEPKESKN